MAPDVALNEKVMKNYPFCRLSGPPNVLIMPGTAIGQSVGEAAARTGRRRM
jgi:phosphotransacetylase